MAVKTTAPYENRIGLPAILLCLCLLALLVSLFGLFRTSGITETRVQDLQVSWQALMEGGVDGAEIMAADRLMQGIVRPAPAVHSAASWSLALGALCLVFVIWLIRTALSTQRVWVSSENRLALNDQAATAKLLDEMAPLVSGDLGVRATASDGTAGELASAFNHAIGELQRLAAVQLKTALMLGESLGQTQELAAAIEQKCSQQMEYIHQSSNLLMGISNATGALSANAAETSLAAQTVLDKVDSVSTALVSCSRQIDGMRRDADMSVRLLQSLDTSVLQIADANAEIEDLARRTDLLAVNTTIKASSDNAPTDVSQLTEEVSRLADALARATGDIASLTRGISTDSSEVMTCIQRSRKNCGVQFGEIHEIVAALAQIRKHTQTVHSYAVKMAEEAVEHAGVVKNLSENINLINQLTEQTGLDARSNAESVDVSRRLANDLRQSTSDFVLPESDASIVDSQGNKSVARRAAERASING